MFGIVFLLSCGLKAMRITKLFVLYGILFGNKCQLGFKDILS